MSQLNGDQKDSVKLSAIEAIYAFSAWLTGSKEKIVLGGNSNCSTIAELVGIFAETNRLGRCADGWTSHVVMPDAYTIADYELTEAKQGELFSRL